MEETLKTYTVIGYYESSGQIFAHSVESNSGYVAMAKAAQELADERASDMILVAAIEGEHYEEQTIFFPGEGVVDGATVIQNVAESYEED